MAIIYIENYEGVPQNRHLSKVDAEEYGVLKTELETQEKKVKELKEGGLPLIVAGLGITALFILVGLGVGLGLGYAGGSLGFSLGVSMGVFGGLGSFNGSFITIGGVLDMVEYFKAKKELKEGIPADRLDEMTKELEQKNGKLETEIEKLEEQITAKKNEIKDNKGKAHQLEHIAMQNGFREIQIEGNQ